MSGCHCSRKTSTRGCPLRSLSAELNALTDHCRRRRGELDQPVLDPALADVVVLQALLAERGWELKVGSALSTPAFRDRLLVALPLLSPDEHRGHAVTRAGHRR